MEDNLRQKEINHAQVDPEEIILKLRRIIELLQNKLNTGKNEEKLKIKNCN